MKEKEEAEENKSKKMGKKVRSRNTEERNLIHIEEDTNSSKLVLITVRTIPHKLGMVLTVTSTRLDSFVLEKNQPPLTSLKRLSK